MLNSGATLSTRPSLYGACATAATMVWPSMYRLLKKWHQLLHTEAVLLK